MLGLKLNHVNKKGAQDNFYGNDDGIHYYTVVPGSPYEHWGM